MSLRILVGCKRTIDYAVKVFLVSFIYTNTRYMNEKLSILLGAGGDRFK